MSSLAYNKDYPTYDFSAIVAENIRALAARRGINQAEIAKRLGLSHATISLRWASKRDWPLDDIARVAAILETTPWDLARPAPEYDNGQAQGLAEVRQLPRLDSNQQPFDYRHGAGQGFATVADLTLRRRVSSAAAA